MLKKLIGKLSRREMQLEEPSDHAGSKRSILGRQADQKGVTLQEVLIGIAVAAALAAATIVIGVQFIGRGQSSAARQTLESASLAVEANYARIVPGGRQNWTGTTMASTTADGLTRAAVIEFNKLGESFTFVGAVGSTASGSSEIDAIDEINSLDQNVVWVKVLAGYVIPAAKVSSSAPTVTITSGKVLILGIRGADGSTMCVINAKDSAPNLISGKGWQAVNEESSTATIGSTVGGAAADCGAFKDHTTTAGDSEEWPRTDQTDTSLGDAKDTGNINYS